MTERRIDRAIDTPSGSDFDSTPMPMSREQFTASAAPAAHFPAPASFPTDYPEHALFAREAEALRDEVLRAGHEPVAAFFTLCLNALRRDGLSGTRVRQFEAAMKPVDELFFANFPEDPRFLRELAHAFGAGEGFPSRRLPTDIDDTLLNVLLEGLPLTAKTRFFDPFMEGGRLVRHLYARTPVRRIVGWDVNPYRVLLLQAEHLRKTRGRATAPAPRFAERNLLTKRPSTVLLLLALAGGIDAGAAISPEGSEAAASPDIPAAYRAYDLGLITLYLAGRALEPGGRFALLLSKEAARNEANAKLRREILKFGSIVGITGLGNDDERLVLLFERGALPDQTYCILKEGDASEIAEGSRFLADPQARFEVR